MSLIVSCMSLYQKYSAIAQYIKLMGFDWVIFRIKYLYRQKSNSFNKINERIIQKSEKLDSSKLFLPAIGWINQNFKGNDNLLDRAENALNGKIYAFSHEYLNYLNKGKIAWDMNPVSKVKSNNSLTWNDLPDFGKYGDIKLIWEASRFPQVYTFINAYAITQNEKYAHACLSQIIDWIDTNPFPHGVNYKCGQEITFRVISWMVAVGYFKKYLSAKDEKRIVKNIYISLLRVDANIDYAARAVKNNHSLSEAVGLIIFGLYFKQFDEADTLLKKGVLYLQKESSYQIYEDGSYIQHSFTYQRLALDILSFAIIVSDKVGFSLPSEIKQRHKKMISFLNTFIQDNGWLSNYGTNDGANLFPVVNSDYRDFRESLNLASAISSQNILYQCSDTLIEFFGLVADKQQDLTKIKEFYSGGYYILKNENIFLFTRCHSYKDRPAQNDMLHVDIWYKGQNIFCDAGSFSYNTDNEFKNNFNGTIGHNTIMINNDNQMEQVLNFGWSNWTKSKLINISDTQFEGEHYGYIKKYGVTCHRSLSIDNNKVAIIDHISTRNNTNIKQIWNTKEKVTRITEFSVRIQNCLLTSNFPIKLDDTFISDYYNSFSKGTKIIIELDSNHTIDIKTTMDFLS